MPTPELLGTCAITKYNIFHHTDMFKVCLLIKKCAVLFTSTRFVYTATSQICTMVFESYSISICWKETSMEMPLAESKYAYEE